MLRQNLRVLERKGIKENAQKGLKQPHSRRCECEYVTIQLQVGRKIQVCFLVSYISADNIGEWKQQGAIKALKI